MENSTINRIDTQKPLRLIMLDIDGVISTEKSQYALDKEKVALLGKIIDATDCKLVISSSWRRHTLEATIENLSTIKEHSVPFVFPYCDRIIGITIRSYQYVTQGIHLSIPRGVEIKQWIDTNIHSDNGKNWSRKTLKDGFSYVILDDDCDMLLEQKNNFVQTDSRLGLSEEDVERAIEILNRKP